MAPGFLQGMELLHFEILRKKQHFMVRAHENWTPMDLKRVIEDILRIPPEKQSLRKPMNEQRTEWAKIDEKQTLHELGFTPKNARADDPAVLALVLGEDNDEPDITPLSIAQPLTPPSTSSPPYNQKKQDNEMALGEGESKSSKNSTS